MLFISSSSYDLTTFIYMYSMSISNFIHAHFSSSYKRYKSSTGFVWNINFNWTIRPCTCSYASAILNTDANDPLVAFGCWLLYGRVVVALTHSPFPFSILSYIIMKPIDAMILLLSEGRRRRRSTLFRLFYYPYHHANEFRKILVEER